MKNFKFPRIVALLTFIMLGWLCIAAEPTYEPIVVEGEGYRLQINIEKVNYSLLKEVESEEFGNYHLSTATVYFRAAYEGFHHYARIGFLMLQPDGSWKRSPINMELNLLNLRETTYIARSRSAHALMLVILRYYDEDGNVQRDEHYDVLDLLDYVKPEERDLFLYEWERQTTALEQIEVPESIEMEQSDASEYLVYNPQGALVRTVSNAGEIRSGLAPGVYVVAIRQANGIVSTEKMIVR